jgi:hypothetical protein
VESDIQGFWKRAATGKIFEKADDEQCEEERKEPPTLVKVMVAEILMWGTWAGKDEDGEKE